MLKNGILNTRYLVMCNLVLLAALVVVAYGSVEKDSTLQSAQRLIVTQKSALDTAHRALYSTAKYKAFLSQTSK